MEMKRQGQFKKGIPECQRLQIPRSRATHFSLQRKFVPTDLSAISGVPSGKWENRKTKKLTKALMGAALLLLLSKFTGFRA